MMDISEPIFLAIDEIVKRRLEDVNYDTTIIGTIIDNSNANNYQYTCSNGSAKFIAYSNDTSFKINETVQITIPNNDYSNQKIIIGRYVGENSLPFGYTEPFDGLIDASGNLINIKNINKTNLGLLANCPNPTEYLLQEIEYPEGLVGFKRLGLQGWFRSWIYSLNPVEGSYGYRLEVESFQGELIEGTNEPKSQLNIFYLDSSDMFGNPYNFQTYFKQEKVFDISNLDKIVAIRLYFYQGAGSFLDGNRNSIPYQDQRGNNFANNLFTKDPYVCLGYDLSEFNEEQALLFTTDKKSYVFNDRPGEKESNQKTIRLRWLHKNAEGEIVIADEPLALAEGWDIRWYRFNMGSPNADEYSGVYWDRIPIQDNDYAILTDQFTCVMNPRVNSANEQIKVIILSKPDEKGKISTIIRSDIIIFTNESEVANSATVDMTAGLSIWCADNSYGNYYIYGQNNNLFDYTQANEVRKLEARFASSKLLASEYEVDATAPTLTEATQITWEFPLTSTMIQVHGFDYNYKNLFKKTDPFVYDENTGEWKYIVKGKDYSECITSKTIDETTNTITDFYFDEEKLPDVDPTGRRYVLEGYYQTLSKQEKDEEGNAIIIDDVVAVKDNVISITRVPELDKMTGLPVAAINAIQEYRVKPTYNASALFNTIKCSIKKNSLTYSATKDLSFGIMGTNGTDATLVIDFDNNQVALTSGKSVDMFKITAHLYDYNHNEVDFNNQDLDLECEWEWYKYLAPEGQKLDIYQRIQYNEDGSRDDDETSIDMNVCFLDSNKTTININDDWFLILKATAKNFGNYDLIAYKAIPIRGSNNYRGMIGATEIIYGTSGNANYYKDPHLLIYADEVDENDMVQGEINTLSIESVDWDIYNPLEAEEAFLGEMSDKDILRPVSMYFKGSEPYGIIAEHLNKICWKQPLVIIQNTYPSGMLNQWDGKSIQMETDKGWFLSPVIAAGKKNGENQFSGVMLGDFDASESAADISGGTGLYGFDTGQLSFGFMEDGTAFIGKAGKGQILFNGNESTIMSAGYKSGTGMKIDLINNTIHAKNGFTLETDTIYFSDTPRQSSFASSDGTISVSAVLNLNNNFMVSSNGNLYANGAYISGEIHSDIGEIGGWIINEYSIYSGNTALYSDNYNGEERLVIGETDNQFWVKKDGTIQAISGTLGGWTLDKTKLAGEGYGYIYLYTDSPAYSIAGSPSVFWRIDVGGKFGVDRDGNIYTSGDIYTTGTIYTDDYFYIRDNGISVGNIHGENSNRAVLEGVYLELSANNNIYINGSTIYFGVSDQKNIRVGTDMTNSHPIYAYFA